MSAKSCLRRTVAVLCAAACLDAAVAVGQLPEFTGRPIVDLIEALRDEGTRIVYSPDALPARLRVTVTPTTSDTFDALREVLAPHGLDVELGPRDTWLIVQRDTALPSPPEPQIQPAATPIRPTLETVVVTASRYPIERESTVSSSTIGRNSIETTPVLGRDPLRITHSLPGMTSDELTSRTHVRGGSFDEVLLLLDGVRLYNPYHLRDFQSIFSSINPSVIEAMDVRTGGYEARYGDKMSGVIDMQSIRPTQPRHHELAVSLLDTSFLSSGLFANGRGAWVTSLRRGNLDALARLGDSDAGSPHYVDFFNRVEFAISPRTRIASGMLRLDDDITLSDLPEATASADDSNNYFWLSLDRSLPSGLEAHYRLSTARLGRARAGTVDYVGKVAGSIADRSDFDRVALTSEWTLSPTQTLRIDWGFALAREKLADRVLALRNDALVVDAPDLAGSVAPPQAANIALERTSSAVHLSFRYQPMPRLITELGMRWDGQSLTRETQLSPRLNLRFDITARTNLRAAWGKFSQPDSLSELAVADGLTSLRPAETSTQSILGLEHAFGDRGLFRAEIYAKHDSNPNLRFENLFERVSVLPELLPDRFAIDPSAAESRGLELSVEGAKDRFSWWANLALSRSRDRLPTGWFRRSWDDGRSLKAGGEWTATAWTVTANLSYRWGWPITTPRLVNGVVTAERYNAERLPDFSSTDVRASRPVEVRHGTFNWYVEVSNLFNHANQCCLKYGPGGSPGTLFTEYDQLLGRVPNIGLRWQF